MTPDILRFWNEFLTPNAELYNASDRQAEYLNNLMFCFLENREKKNIFKMYHLSGVWDLFFLKYLS
ncbi:hypothetical protein LEP1GSC188_1897 [Leptospira weilii serovar Topaz str. LT2116]|uniref:Uncharacterized protein n=1 Tax=Leptospira weilii serovar Topaz str. LT2116 TaxID=1088540 RepID=M3G2C3_9LEPT|nr:hypothetical protein LEP1GSC188_1897 [Leptospira weilii serovar Topaz str. LT2116]